MSESNEICNKEYTTMKANGLIHDGFWNQNSVPIPGDNGYTGSTCRNAAGHIREWKKPAPAKEMETRGQVLVISLLI
jgi:hypothetical protein